jgi:hypothetical protein
MDLAKFEPTNKCVCIKGYNYNLLPVYKDGYIEGKLYNYHFTNLGYTWVWLDDKIGFPFFPDRRNKFTNHFKPIEEHRDIKLKQLGI